VTLLAVRHLIADTPDVHAPIQEGRSRTEAHLLPPNEQTLFELLMAAKSDADIAQDLQIGVAAAKCRRRKLVQKLNAATRAEVDVRAPEWDLAVSRLLSE
jgi:DNA-binding NarL/FixJ family response regulator